MDLTGQRARVFIAAPAVVIRQLSAALGQDVEIIGAATWEDAVQRLSEGAPNLIVVCYVFDELRPYRFIQYLKDSEYRHVPVILVRAITIPWGTTQEDEVRRGYADMGVAAFLNFSDVANTRGLDAALQEFGRVAVSLLPTA